MDSQSLLQHAEFGDLRPQVNPLAVSARLLSAAEGRQVEPLLLNRFLPLGKPIADARAHSRPDMRLDDAGPFFYLVETLERIGGSRLNETLLIFLDEFAQLEQRSYDQLYLWSIVQLSRSEPGSIEVFWPLAIALDLRYRPEPWSRLVGTTPFDQPYRFSELLFTSYVKYTLQRWHDPAESPPRVKRRYPSLLTCLKRVTPLLADDQREFLFDTLREMARHELTRERKVVAFSDALSFLQKPPGNGPAEPAIRIVAMDSGPAPAG